MILEQVIKFNKHLELFWEYLLTIYTNFMWMQHKEKD